VLFAVAGDAALGKKKGWNQKDPRNIQQGTKFERIFTDDKSIIDGCGSTNQEHGGIGTEKRRRLPSWRTQRAGAGRGA
jgi:hypothetical protein